MTDVSSTYCIHFTTRKLSHCTPSTNTVMSVNYFSIKPEKKENMLYMYNFTIMSNYSVHL